MCQILGLREWYVSFFIDNTCRSPTGMKLLSNALTEDDPYGGDLLFKGR